MFVRAPRALSVGTAAAESPIVALCQSGWISLKNTAAQKSGKRRWRRWRRKASIPSPFSVLQLDPSITHDDDDASDPRQTFVQFSLLKQFWNVKEPRLTGGLDSYQSGVRSGFVLFKWRTPEQYKRTKTPKNMFNKGQILLIFWYFVDKHHYTKGLILRQIKVKLSKNDWADLKFLSPGIIPHPSS